MKTFYQFMMLILYLCTIAIYFKFDCLTAFIYLIIIVLVDKIAFIISNKKER